MPILDNMGWNYSLGETKIISEDSQKLEAVLFADKNKHEAYLNINSMDRQSAWAGIDIILVAKKAASMLNTGQVSKKNNPYLQTLAYLQSSKIRRGFLTNGRQWYLIDNTGDSCNKKYLSFSLAKILQEGDKRNFELFWRIFHVNSFVAADQYSSPSIDLLSEKDQKWRQEIEADFKAALYYSGSQFSLFEETGRAIFQAVKKMKNPPELDEIFRNSLYFVYRLFFLAYLEDHYRNLLTDNPEYGYMSLWKLRAEILEIPDSYLGWDRLNDLFSILDTGSETANMPLFGGGLFDRTKAPLLNLSQLFSDYLLSRLLKCLYFDSRGYLRDFTVFAPSHLGTLYEGLLEFQFRVAEEELFYAAAVFKNKKMEGYFGKYEISKLKNNKYARDFIIIRVLARGELYLVNSNNNRKSSGSYYTPDSLAFPLVTRGIELQLTGQLRDCSILDMRILDCSCGCGHLLLAALNVLANKALDRLEEDHNLSKALASELWSIRADLQRYGINPGLIELDEILALKRILLKKVIYGVDWSPFAVELTQLGLCVDTFIFGTPMSFIEHRIKCGNSLIGADIQSPVTEEASNALFKSILFEKLEPDQKQAAALSFLNDADSDEIGITKKKYKHEILLITKLNNEILDYANYQSFMELEGKKVPALESLLNPSNCDESELEELKACRAEIEKYRQKFGFFNWENEFPEVFSAQNYGGPGFHVLVGNPPWDKTRFEEPLFFAQYRSDYRTLPNSQKKEIACELLEKPAIKERYEREKELFFLINGYLKKKYHYSRGAGDSNLFRFFVERGLGLLAEGGSLNYVLPTSLLTEDSSTGLRKYILENCSLNVFDGFENRRRIFSDIDSRYKFGLIQIQKVKNPDQVAKIRFLLTEPAELDVQKKSFLYPLADVKSTSPKHWSYMEVAGGAGGLAILKRLYAKYPALKESWLDLRRELDATIDKKIFREKEGSGYLPLYKGEMIWQYQALASKPGYWLDKAEFDSYLLSAQINRLVSDIRNQISGSINSRKPDIIPGSGNFGKWLTSFLNVSWKDLAEFIIPERRFFRLGVRGIARDTNERTLVAAILPPNIGVQHSLWISVPGQYVLDLERKIVNYRKISLNKLLFSQAIFNSLTADWLLRASVTMNVSKTYLYRLPIPQPSDREFSDNQNFQAIIRDSALLSLYNAPEILAEIKTALKIRDSELIRTTQAFEHKKAALDLSVARLYGLDSQDLKYITPSFKVLNRKKPEYIQKVLKMADLSVAFS
ncbi:MAG: hypothetical protein LBP22_00820 [Deltaproteobacteria bacterium]|nr:hypothetical protein [Deltaproteobacteria bacterium]